MGHPTPAAQVAAQVDRHPHPIRTPALRHLLERRQVRLRIEPIRGPNRTHQTRLTRRQLVHRAQRTQPNELRPELSDAIEALQSLERFLARERPQRLGVELARKRRATQSVEVLDLAPEESSIGLDLDQARRRRESPEMVAVNIDLMT